MSQLAGWCAAFAAGLPGAARLTAKRGSRLSPTACATHLVEKRVIRMHGVPRRARFRCVPLRAAERRHPDARDHPPPPATGSTCRASTAPTHRATRSGSSPTSGSSGRASAAPPSSRRTASRVRTRRPLSPRRASRSAPRRPCHRRRNSPRFGPHVPEAPPVSRRRRFAKLAGRRARPTDAPPPPSLPRGRAVAAGQRSPRLRAAAPGGGLLPGHELRCRPLPHGQPRVRRGALLAPPHRAARPHHAGQGGGGPRVRPHAPAGAELRHAGAVAARCASLCPCVHGPRLFSPC